MKIRAVFTVRKVLRQHGIFGYDVFSMTFVIGSCLFIYSLLLRVSGNGLLILGLQLFVAVLIPGIGDRRIEKESYKQDKYDKGNEVSDPLSDFAFFILSPDFFLLNSAHLL